MHLSATPRSRFHEETLVEGLADALAAPAGVDANEVAIDLARIGLRLKTR